MDAAEFLEWMAYYSVEPFGEERADLRMGILASTLTSIWCKKGLAPKEFMPDFNPPKRKSINWAALEKAMLIYTQFAGGTVR